MPQSSMQRFVSLMIGQFILALVVLSRFSLVTLAQAPPSFEISLTPQIDHAVSGQPFTYNLTILVAQADSATANKVQSTPTLNVSLKTSTFPTTIFFVGISSLILAIIGLAWISKSR